MHMQPNPETLIVLASGCWARNLGVSLSKGRSIVRTLPRDYNTRVAMQIVVCEKSIPTF